MRETGPAARGAEAILGPTPRRRPVWPWVVASIAVLVVIALIVGFTVTVPYYSLSPGTAMPVGPLISFAPGHGHGTNGEVFLTDVSLSRVRLIDLIPDYFESDVALVKAEDLLGTTPPGQYEEQSLLQMSDSKSFAEVAALRRLGYTVPEVDKGALVLQVQPGSPASSRIHVGDAITAADGTPTPTAEALVAFVRSRAPGDLVTLSVLPLGTTRVESVALRLGSAVVNGTRLAFLGVALETKATFDLPFGVRVNSDGIGGPSAGLAFTLGIVDGLSAGDITGGKRVAATGTMDPDGNVGDVGGVAQKTVAVKDAGATLFLVPPQEKQVAQSHAGRGLKVVAVSTLDQALTALRNNGGNLAGIPPARPTTMDPA